MMTLDQALYCPYKERRRKIAAVKIDVESHEMFVIRGGRRFFEEMQVCVLHGELFSLGACPRFFLTVCLPCLACLYQHPITGSPDYL